MDVRLVWWWPRGRQSAPAFRAVWLTRRLRASRRRGVIHAEDSCRWLVSVRRQVGDRISSSRHNGSRPKHRIHCTDALCLATSAFRQARLLSGVARWGGGVVQVLLVVTRLLLVELRLVLVLNRWRAGVVQVLLVAT